MVRPGRGGIDAARAAAVTTARAQPLRRQEERMTQAGEESVGHAGRIVIAIASAVFIVQHWR